jgi:hypothetical protein
MGVAVGVEALGVLPHDDQVGAGDDGVAALERLGGAHVGVQVEVLADGAAGVELGAERLGVGRAVVGAEQPTVGLREGGEGGLGGGFAAFLYRPEAQGQFLPGDGRGSGGREGGVGDQDGGGHDLGADAVAVQDTEGVAVGGHRRTPLLRGRVQPVTVRSAWASSESTTVSV